MTRARRRGALLVAAAIGVVLITIIATTVLGGPGRRVETGIVVAVHATSLTNVQGFSIRTQDGRTVDFRVGTIDDAARFPPEHLAVHKVSLVPVQVTYVEESGALVAVHLEDAH